MFFRTNMAIALDLVLPPGIHCYLGEKSGDEYLEKPDMTENEQGGKPCKACGVKVMSFVRNEHSVALTFFRSNRWRRRSRVSEKAKTFRHFSERHYKFFADVLSFPFSPSNMQR